MPLPLLLETTLAPLIFFGCEVTALNQSALLEAGSSRLSECRVQTHENADTLPGMRRVDGACVVNRGQSSSKSTVSDLVGGIYGPGNSLPMPSTDPNAPNVQLTASPNELEPGQSALLLWEGSNVDQCTASGGWSGLREASGSEPTPALTKDTTYSLLCEGPNGEATSSALVRVANNNEPPVVSLTATPATVNSGGASMLSWSVTNADSCEASNAWSGARDVSGSESTGALEQTSAFTLNCTGSGGAAGETVVVSVDGAPPPPATFAKVLIDADQAPWGKNLGDVDGDGQLDILTGGGLMGSNVYWYRAPNWQKFQIGSVGGGDDLQVGDINGDGAPDVVVNRDPISWYENPMGSGGSPEDMWTVHPIANYRSHDAEIVDIDNDGKADIVIRFAGDTYGTTRVFLQGNTPQDWTTVFLDNDSAGTGGLAVADIDGDGRLDVLGDGYWLRQPAPNQITNGSAWLRHEIGSWPAGSSIDTADLNGDGNLDVTLAVSEVGVGQIAWFEAPADPLTQSWIRHVIGTVEDVHRHHLVDMNNDGQLDIVFAEMYQSATDRVGVYYNDGDGESWTLDVIETHASHNLAVGDVDNDGDTDILGANWQYAAPADGDVFLWINQLND